jgi:D-serine deaminase-like pyridoxal phosphate-dependent protein
MTGPRPRTLADIPTPALVIDLGAMERNIRTMAGFFADGPCKLRPHFKAHKTPEIARRQLAAGSCVGLTCATVSEAEVASAFCDDILIANQVIGADKCARVAELAKSVDIAVAIESPLGFEQLAKAAEAAGSTIGVLVEVNIGFRTGTPPGEPAVALARRSADTAGIEFRGLMGYAGHAAAMDDRPQREAAECSATVERLMTSVSAVRDAGLPCAIVSAGSTGTYDITSRIDGVTEIQAGSYVLMDTAYAKFGLPFEQAFWVQGTVVSRPGDTRLTADCGHKSCTMDHGLPDVKDVDGATVMFLADEHAIITVPPESTLGPGDPVALWPSHIDPTINLHDIFYVVDDDKVVDVWPITARGYSEQRQTG